MRRIISTISLCFAIAALYAQQAPLGDSGTYLLHKFAQHIGKETFRVSKEGDVFTYSSDFKFTDRGQAVPLKTQLQITSAMQPHSLVINGSTSRLSTIRDSVVINGNTVHIKVNDSTYTRPLSANSFPVGGYSPGLVQLALVHYWKKQGQPARINLLPTGAVQIKKDGVDTLTLGGQSMVWDRYVISGLIWGNELVWLDKEGALASIITIDAEGDKLEMMQEKYEPLLPELIGKAARYGMRLFVSAIGKQQPVSKKTIAIKDVAILNVETGELKKNMTVLINDDKITAIGDASKTKIPAGATVIPGKGKTLLPGLWDMHAHFQQAEWGPAYLAAGVTTVRDCGNEFDFINAIKQVVDAGEGIGPQIIKAGIIDGPGNRALGVIRASNAEEAANAVKLYKDNGFEQIKIYSSITPAVVKAITTEAHRLGMTVTGHIPQGMTIFQGIDSGMDQVNHISYVYGVLKVNKDRSINWDDTTNTAILKRLAEKKVVIDPTVSIYELIFRNTNEDVLAIEPGYNTLPEPLQVLFKSIGMPVAQAIAMKPYFTSLLTLIKKMKENGVTFVAGTDMGFPGYSVAREVELYVSAGLTPLEAIQTATIIPARVMKKDNSYGTIAVEKKADLILIVGNPLVNIRDIRNVVSVIKNGVVYDPVALHKMAGFQIK